MQTHFCSGKSIGSVQWVRLLLTLVMLIALLPRPVSAMSALQASPALLSLAMAKPTQTVRVIIQKGGLPGTTEERRDTVENAVALATGVVTRDLSMINAFVAEVPASALPALAARSDVRWISLDAPVVSTAADAHRIAIPHQANGNQNQPLLNTY